MTNPDPLILALDIATKTGWAGGKPSGTPISGSIRFGDSTSEPDEVFAKAIKWFSMFLQSLRERGQLPDTLIVEAMLPPTAMKEQTSRTVRDRLAGLHGCFLGIARLRGIGEITQANVGNVRAHFIGDRRCRREQAKRETLLQCKVQGWDVVDDNAADACALWSYACTLIRPELGLRVVPLFHRRSA